jgi:hypothetical protein
VATSSAAVHDREVPSDWIACRLGRLCADAKGRVGRGPVLFDHAARVALIIDLALLGRVTRTLDQIDIDTTPTGFAPADAVLCHIDHHPDRRMTELFAHGPVTLLDVLDPVRLSARPLRRSKSVLVPLELIAIERDGVSAALQGQPDSEKTAVLAMIAYTLRLTLDVPSPSALAPYGRNAWLITDSLAYLDATRDRFSLVSAAGIGGG